MLEQMTQPTNSDLAIIFGMILSAVATSISFYYLEIKRKEKRKYGNRK